MIKIQKNTNGDTRVAKGVPTIAEFNEANKSHQVEVYSLMKEFADEIKREGNIHDFTKTIEPEKSMFYVDFVNALRTGTNFVESKWYKKHIVEERHHLNNYCHDDVTLIDVLEMICDCVCAGLARKGEVYPIEISSEILRKALKNTIEFAKSLCEVEE